MQKNITKTSKIRSLDTTQGVIWKQILTLFFPILLGTFFQQLYNSVDAIIVGQFLGKEALAAVGGGSAVLLNLLVGFFVGIGSGATVVVSQFFGARNERNVSYAVHTTFALALVSGILITILGLLGASFSLKLIGTPEELFDISLTYMKIYLGGVLPLLVYNIGAGILRAVGDSKSPLYFLIAGTMLNIVLDFLFIGFFKWGIEGAAWATVVSQTFSMILTCTSLMKTNESHKLVLKKIRFSLPILKSMLLIGFPAGFQSVLYSLSNILIQAKINVLGTNSVAAWAAFGKIDSLFWMILSAFGIALSTFAGQNYGAQKYDRMLKGTKQCTLLAFGTTIAISTIFYVTAPFLYSIFINDSEVIGLGVYVLRLMVPYFFVFVPIEILTGALRGAGKTLVPTIITATGTCLLRVLWLTIVVPLDHTLFTITLSYPITWVITSTSISIYFLRKKWIPKHD